MPRIPDFRCLFVDQQTLIPDDAVAQPDLLHVLIGFARSAFRAYRVIEVVIFAALLRCAETDLHGPVCALQQVCVGHAETLILEIAGNGDTVFILDYARDIHRARIHVAAVTVDLVPESRAQQHRSSQNACGDPLPGTGTHLLQVVDLFRFGGLLFGRVIPALHGGQNAAAVFASPQMPFDRLVGLFARQFFDVARQQISYHRTRQIILHHLLPSPSISLSLCKR